MQGLTGTHPNTAIDLAKADHGHRIERAHSRRLAASMRSTTSAHRARSGDSATTGRMGRAARTMATIVTAVVVVGAVLIAATPAHANFCIDDRAFAEANGCGHLYDPAAKESVVATVGVVSVERAWLLRIDPVDAAAFHAGQPARVVAAPRPAV